MTVVTVKVTGLAEFAARCKEAPRIVRTELRKAMRASVQAVKKRAVSGAPRHHGPQSASSKAYGPLARKISGTTKATGATATGRITAKPFYGRFIEGGTHAHSIPKGETARVEGRTVFVRKHKKGEGAAEHPHGGVLAFQVDGQTVFARHVKHPGAAARPFMEPALDFAGPEIQAAFDAASAAIGAQLAGAAPVDGSDGA